MLELAMTATRRNEIPAVPSKNSNNLTYLHFIRSKRPELRVGCSSRRQNAPEFSTDTILRR
jgi:hypothetical protein